MQAPRIDRLHLASLTAPAGHPSAGAAIEVFAYLVRHGDLTLLVDTGMGDDSGFLDKLYAAKRTGLATALKAVGVNIEDIDAVVNSHLHFDHCGGNRLFPDAPIYMQAREREAARALHYTVENWVAPEGVTIREVDGDHQIAPGLTLLFTPGHTPGHQSLLVETPNGSLMVGAQVAYTAAEFEAGGDVAEAHEGMGETYRASIERLKSLAPRCVFFSHDRREWPG
ncbi:MAG: N-acyl homoserine lactonase family protein [Caulobacteraceae bacterium]|nr:N-acyl homoserine lactonase family protein [Caulobacteraceae bacterium]